MYSWGFNQFDVMAWGTSHHLNQLSKIWHYRASLGHNELISFHILLSPVLIHKQLVPLLLTQYIWD